MKKKNIIIIICTILVIGLIIFGIINRGENSKHERAELKEQRVKLETRKNEVFFQEGFSEEYYRIDEELREINKEIQKNEITSGPPTIFFTLFGLIFILIFGTAVVTIFKTITMHRKISKSATHSANNSHDIEKMASILGKVATQMAIDMNPEYKALNCPNCGASLTDDVKVCEYCNTPLIKVAAKGK